MYLKVYPVESIMSSLSYWHTPDFPFTIKIRGRNGGWWEHQVMTYKTYKKNSARVKKTIAFTEAVMPKTIYDGSMNTKRHVSTWEKFQPGYVVLENNKVYFLYTKQPIEMLIGPYQGHGMTFGEIFSILAL